MQGNYVVLLENVTTMQMSFLGNRESDYCMFM